MKFHEPHASDQKPLVVDAWTYVVIVAASFHNELPEQPSPSVLDPPLLRTPPITSFFRSNDRRDIQSMVFTARRSYASAVLGVVILSVRPTVFLFVCHTRAL